MSTSFFQDMLGSIAERGRHLIDRTPARASAKKGRKGSARSADTIEELSRGLLSGRGEASGVALARQLLDLYAVFRSLSASRSSGCLAATSDLTSQLFAWPGPRTTRPEPEEPTRTPPRGRAAASGDVPPPEPRARWHQCTGPDAPGPRRSTAARTQNSPALTMISSTCCTHGSTAAS